ncbi:MAG: hypothetical protein ABFD86_06485 [Bryobacteraceae bacterium]
MKTTFYVLAGALLTLSGALAAGRLLLSALRVRLAREEERLFAFVAGAACWSAAAWLLAWLHVARKGVFVTLASILIAAAFLAWRKRGPCESLPPLSRRTRYVCAALFAGFLLMYVVYAAAPETSLTGNHLGRVEQMREARGLPAPVAGIVEPRPSAIEFFYLPAFLVGRHVSAALAHLGFLAALALGLASYGRRSGCANAGMFAGFVIFLSPLAAVDATSARTESALACTLFFCYYALELWRNTGQRRMVVVAGALLAFALTIGTSSASVEPIQRAARPEYLMGRAIELTTMGATGQSFFGPVFLLAPLGLLALRKPTGRRALAGAAFAALWLVGAAHPEAALPLAVFVALAMGIALMDSPGMIPLLVAAHAVMSLPQVTTVYSWPDTWRLREWPLKAALHRVSEDAYLMPRMYPAFGWARTIDEVAGKGGLVFALAEPARAYCSARVIVAGESGGGRAVRAMLEAAVRPSPPGDVRRAAISVLKKRGFGWLFVPDAGPCAKDLRANPAVWGITPMREAHDAIVYRLD